MEKEYIQYSDEINDYKDDVVTDLNSKCYLFDQKINKLILETPTGELRNELTDLNILFLDIVENVNKLI